VRMLVRAAPLHPLEGPSVSENLSFSINHYLHFGPHLI
jgi:hypothetical protein